MKTLPDGDPSAESPETTAPHDELGLRSPGPVRVRGLDGLRAVAVAAVVLGHLQPEWLPGGFLGVDVFFALSGFLITGRLLETIAREGRLGLGRFLDRRVRRLAPAMLIMVFCGLVLTAARSSPARAGSAAVDAIAALFQVANWRFIDSGQRYSGGIGVQSPFRHTWSLSVEGQFYLLWPLVLLAATRWGRLRRDNGTLAAFCTALAVLSAAEMMMFVSAGRLERAFNGTDTRAQALLLGCALAAFPTRPRPLPRPVGTVLALGGLAVLAVLFRTASQTDPWVYRGGFLVVGVATCAVVVAVRSGSGDPGSLALRSVPLDALGRRSYGIYLWYWVVLALVPLDGPGWSRGWVEFAQVGIVLVLAFTSFRLVETPVLVRPKRLHLVLIAAGAFAVVATAIAIAATHGPPRVVAEHPRSSPEITARADAPAPAEAGGAPASLKGVSSVLLVGDSIAASLEPGFEAYLGGHDIVFEIQAQPGCGFLAGDQLDQYGAPVAWDRECKKRSSAVDERLAAAPVDLVVALSTTEVADRVVNGEIVRVTGDLDKLTALYVDAIDRLSAGGAQVVLVVPAPVPDEVVNERLPILREAMERAAVERRDVASVVDSGPIVCGGAADACSKAQIDGIPLRPGGYHFSPEGAEAFVPLLFRAMHR